MTRNTLPGFAAEASHDAIMQAHFGPFPSPGTCDAVQAAAMRRRQEAPGFNVMAAVSARAAAEMAGGCDQTMQKLIALWTQAAQAEHRAVKSRDEAQAARRAGL